jgi:hypothetical protein
MCGWCRAAGLSPPIYIFRGLSREVSRLELIADSTDKTGRVLLATIRDGGMCPCPRCLIPKTEMHLMGFARDISARVSKARKYLGLRVRAARVHIYKLAYGIGSDKVNDSLKESSSVPTLVSAAPKIPTSVNTNT